MYDYFINIAEMSMWW